MTSLPLSREKAVSVGVPLSLVRAGRLARPSAGLLALRFAPGVMLALAACTARSDVEGVTAWKGSLSLLLQERWEAGVARCAPRPELPPLLPDEDELDLLLLLPGWPVVGVF